jgi:dTDP-4-amino-4,6-dideoxygalactose transaminase
VLCRFYDKAFANHPNNFNTRKSRNSIHTFSINIQLRILNGKKKRITSVFSRKRISRDDLLSSALRKQKAYYQESNDADFVNTDKLLDQVISLPMHTELEEEQLKFITDSVLEFMK